MTLYFEQNQIKSRAHPSTIYAGSKNYTDTYIPSTLHYPAKEFFVNKQPERLCKICDKKKENNN